MSRPSPWNTTAAERGSDLNRIIARADWMNDALCATDPHWWDLTHDAQIAVCAGCPVTHQCDAYARAARLTDVVAAGRVWRERDHPKLTLAPTPEPAEPKRKRPCDIAAHQRAMDRMHEAIRLIDAGTDPAEACRRVGIKAATLQSRLYRTHTRNDLIHAIAPAVWAERKAA